MVLLFAVGVPCVTTGLTGGGLVADVAFVSGDGSARDVGGWSSGLTGAGTVTGTPFALIFGS